VRNNISTISIFFGIKLSVSPGSALCYGVYVSHSSWEKRLLRRVKEHQNKEINFRWILYRGN